MVLLFFCCCCFLLFWLCLFAYIGAFAAPWMVLCLCLWLTSINTRFSPFLSVLFLLVVFFLRHSKLSSVLAVLLLCFLLCCFGRAVVVFSFFVLIFLLLKLNSALPRPCLFLLPWECCFCRLCGHVEGVAFFSLCPPVIMHVKQCLPCALPHPASPSFRFPVFHNNHMHPSNPCGHTCTLFARAHMIMPVLVFVLVFVCLLRALCVCTYLFLSLLVCLCLCFVFTYVSVVVLCVCTCVCMCISRLCVCLWMYVF